MKPLEQLAHRVTFRSGIIVFAAMVVLALSSTSARRVGLAVIARPRGVGRAGVPQAHLLPPRGKGRSLRGVGAADDFLSGTEGGVQTAYAELLRLGERTCPECVR
jgi:hypothetical protein